jgi:hypothetical protein
MTAGEIKDLQDKMRYYDYACARGNLLPEVVTAVGVLEIAQQLVRLNEWLKKEKQ